MRVVVQRVSHAKVEVANGEGESAVTGQIDRGLVVLVGVGQGDTEAEVDFIAGKLLGLRIFPDDAGKMNRDVGEAGGGLLVVSQFTLYGDVRKGRRPAFDGAAPPEVAQRLYLYLVGKLRESG